MRITQRQLRQIIKEELHRSLRESHYPFTPIDSVKLPGNQGALGYTTSELSDPGGYVWQFKISPAWTGIKQRAEAVEIDSSPDTMGTAPELPNMQELTDNFQIWLTSARPGARLPAGLAPGDLPVAIFDGEYFTDHGQVDRILVNLERLARSQGKSNLADNIRFIIEFDKVSNAED